ncbi:DUF2244 domain-containing protein [Breoghania sp.]|uniref:DUF2244 domain-containing protein n=1 Tax=Breoghania sp. TaxID=2065378 RepID=UPI002AA824A2|nr:DUF2244 domain-containing protein [Breoghania sp.]
MSDANVKKSAEAEETSAGRDHPVDPFFSAVLTPYRSLGPKGFLALMLIFGGVSFFTGLFFVSIGAWPVFGFFGLDVALVWFAFRSNYRHARAFEEVHVSAEEVILRKVSPRGESQLYRFNPVWVRIAVERIEDEGAIRLCLRSHGNEVELGHFLSPLDRQDFASALAGALSAARGGGPAPRPAGRAHGA